MSLAILDGTLEAFKPLLVPFSTGYSKCGFTSKCSHGGKMAPVKRKRFGSGFGYQYLWIRLNCLQLQQQFANINSLVSITISYIDYLLVICCYGWLTTWATITTWSIHSSPGYVPTSRCQCDGLVKQDGEFLSKNSNVENNNEYVVVI